MLTTTIDIRDPRPPGHGLPTAPFLAALAMLLAGCQPGLRAVNPVFNQRPTLELTGAPGNASSRYEYLFRVYWVGHDPDGRVDHYLYAVDPPGPTQERPLPDTAWVRTSRTEQLLRFSATRPDTIRPNENGSADFHTLVIKAIDNGGPGGPLQSAPQIRSFFTYTIAPTVEITSPAPSDRARAYVPPTVRIRWNGTDPDGILNNKKPNYYKYVLLTSNTPVTQALAISNPDSVRRYFAPRHWAGWDSVGPDTTFKIYSGLVPGQDYVFCVVAFDEAGAYSPVFSLNSNMLNMRASTATLSGPRLTAWNDIFYYQFTPSALAPFGQNAVRLEIPADERIDFHWTAEATAGAHVTGFRWALDIEDLTDPTPRSNEHTDLSRWSAWSSLGTDATVGPFAGNEDHNFYIQATDNTGFTSLAVVNFLVVRSTLEKPLLIVNDTRLPVDQRSPGAACMDRPRGRWPMAAELDTFPFARGGVPWRCYPAGTTSPTGIFFGYEYDTLGTRTGTGEVRVPLAKLGKYRRVIWITDSNGGTNTGYGTNLATSVSALRYMSTPGRANSLGAYIRQGGDVWLVGGGGAFASLMPFNKLNNDITSPAPGTTFSESNGELVPGRLMFDSFRWQSEIKNTYSRVTVTRHLGRHDSSGTIPAAYARLPRTMRAKSAGLGDAFPPWRTVTTGDFYQENFDVEYLSRANRVLEDLDPSLTVLDERSTLDTLYHATGNGLVPPSFNRANVCMTRYVGPSSRPVIFTGFNVWNWTRGDARALVDAVLQDFWGLAPR